MEKLYFLKFVINGHPLFKDDTSFSPFSSSKVFIDNKNDVTKFFNNFYFNNVIALVGKNATGKTTLMKLVIGILNLLTNPETQIIKSTCLTEVLRKKNPINMKIYFYGTDKKIIKDEISFDINPNSDTKEWIISSEKIYEKKVLSSTRKKYIFDFDEKSLPIFDRDKLETGFPNNISIFNIYFKNKYITQPVYERLFTTNVNALLIETEETVPPELLNYLDPSIDYLKVCAQETEDGNKKAYYRLKFKNSLHEITEFNFATLINLLSSGTQKAITLYDMIINTLKNGGILFVDEIENHFNTEIVKDFINFFKDPSINKHGAILIFSTHYSEMLDDIERNDSIYISNRTENDKVKLIKYSDLDVRNDFSKTEIYKASSLVETAPSYDAYMNLKRATKSLVKGGVFNEQ